jgi:TPR repeat protein
MMFFIRLMGYGALTVLLAWGAVAQAIAQVAVAPNDQINAGVAAMERGHYSIAMRAFRADADLGNAMAQNNIGYLYEQGLGVGQSYPEAMAWYRKAAEQKLPQAQFNIGTLYFYGYGVEQNQREAVGWFRQAARQDLADAQYMLG